MVGALAGTRLLPAAKEGSEEAIQESVPGVRLKDNLKAFSKGMALIG
jgi:Pyruvate/2-oxoacid:ferredoxin oxidoreductase gamma subunit